MNITTSITLNMQTPGYVVAYEPQGNKLSRFITATLKNGSASWSVPSGATAMIRVAKPDGTFAVYDKNEKGQPAYTISGSTVTIELVGAALAAAGDALVTVMFLDSTGSNLSPFSFRLIIMPSAVSDDEIASSDYFNIFQETLDRIQQMLTETQAMYGSPLTAATASAMTNTSKIYVYVGAESGYSYGHWYYYNGSAWVDGGIYNSEGINSNWLYEAFFTGTIENTSLAHFTDGADNVPVKALTVAIDPVQSGTGDPSPDNVRPITGWTGANVHVAGKNLLAFSLDQIKAANTGGTWSDNTYNYRGISFKVKSVNNRVTEINVSGTATAVSLMYLPVNLTVPEATIITGCPAGGSTNSYLLDVNGGFWPDSGSGRNLPENYQIGSFRIRVANGFTASNLVFKPMLRFASVSDSDFEPCGTVFPISFGSAGTVYGGTLDVLSGELTVDRAKLAITSSMNIDTLTNATSGNGIYITSALPTAMNRPSGICTHAVVGEYLSAVNNMMLGNGNRYIYWTSIMDLLGISTVAEFKSWLDTQTVEVVFELATPQTYTLTAPEVLTLLGENNIWADTGDIEELVYRADASLYLDSKISATKSIIAGIETNMVATKSYSIGDLLIVGDVLYKVASPIASGATFTPGTNVNATTVAEQLILLANS